MKIQFVKKISDCIIQDKLPNDTFIIYRDGYDVPNVKGVRDIIEFEKFKSFYDGLHIGMIIFIGLNRIINPSNRCDFIFEFLQTLTPHIPKISIDIFPFIGEPWRLWWHYSVCQCNKFGVPYSYSLETEWQHWFYRDKEESEYFSNENIKKYITDTYSNLDLLKYESNFYELGKSDLKWYEEVKEFVLNKYTTPKLWINDLLSKCNKKFKIRFDFDSYRAESKNGGFFNQGNKYRLPNLGIYRFVNEENKRRLNIYNNVVKCGTINEEV